ncbi:MAG: NUDIX domain-containing protein [Candidatus Saccharimonadales bacterium]
MTTPAKYDTATPYLCAYVMLRDGNKIAMVLRTNTGWMDSHWGLLAGKVEKDETFTQAAIREAKEEGGVTIKPEDLHLKLIMQRRSDDSDWVNAVFEAKRWEGQAHNAEPHLHSELGWFDVDDVPENTIPDIKLFLECIQEGKTYLEHGWQ